MDGLPTGWESDYDGSRWLYRYAPTGRIQFTFPKPGDEFPQFDASDKGPISLTPDERLAYELRHKLLNEGMPGQGSTIPRKGKAGTKDDNFGTKDDNFGTKTASGFFDPSGFMYFEEGADNGELTPSAGEDHAGPEYPLGVAELASNDTMLCAEEMAPIELDASPSDTVVTNAHAENVDVAPVVAKMSSTEQAAAIRAAPTTPRVALHPVSPPLPTSNAELAKASVMDRPATKQAPMVMLGRSVDDIQTVPSSLQPHTPSGNRPRSRTTSHEPWTPTIKFVQTGQVQESKVSVSPGPSPGFLSTSPGFLALQQPTQLSKVSEWLHQQSFVEPASDQLHDIVPVDTFPDIPPPLVLNAARHQVHDQGSASPQPTPAQAETPPVSRSEQPPPLVAGGNSPSSNSPNKLYHGPKDRVVESIIEIPNMRRIGATRGVQLKDLAPGHARKTATKSKGFRQRRKRFSWEEETGSSDEGTTEDSMSTLDSRPKTPTKPLTLAHASPRQRYVVVHQTPRTSPLPSPSVLLGGHLSPVHAQKGVVVVEHTVLQPCAAIVETATIDTFSDKSLPPLPLTKKQWSGEDGRHGPDKTYSRSTPSTPGQLTARPFAPPPADQHLTVRPGHKRSVSQLEVPNEGLKPAVKRHSRSHSLTAPIESSAPSSAPFDNGDPLRSTDTSTMSPPKQEQADAKRVHKSHDRLSIRVTSKGIFPFHPLRSAPLYSPDSEIDDHASPPLDLDLELTPKPYMGSTSQATKSIQRPAPLQLKVPFYPGLPSSPRPSPRFQPKLNATVPVGNFKQESKTKESAAVPEIRLPVPGLEPSTTAVVGADDLNNEPNMSDIDVSGETKPSTSQRRLSESTVSSVSSSIFSSLRDSSVSVMSATSSTDDSHFPLLADLTAELAALEKSQAQLRQHRRAAFQAANTGVEQMPINRAHMLALTSPLVKPPPNSDPAKATSPPQSSVYVPAQRPKNIPEWVRPAGMPAQEVVPVPPPIPTVVVRAPTVRLRDPRTRFSGRKGSLVQSPPSLAETPPAVPQEVNIEEQAADIIETIIHVSDVAKRPILPDPGVPAVEVVDMPPTPNDLLLGSPESPLFDLSSLHTPAPTKVSTPATTTSVPVETLPVIRTPPVIDITDTPGSVAASSAADSMARPEPLFIKSPITKVLLPMDDGEEDSRPQSFLQSLRKSWRASTLNLSRPSLTAPDFQNSHIRAKSQSALPEPQGMIFEAVAAAKKQRSEVMASGRQSGQESGDWPARDSVGVNVDSISNVGAAIRFFNTSLQSLRPKSETDLEPGVLGEEVLSPRPLSPMPLSPRPVSPSSFAGVDITTTAVTVARRRGPPVVVRVPSMQT